MFTTIDFISVCICIILLNLYYSYICEFSVQDVCISCNIVHCLKDLINLCTIIQGVCESILFGVPLVVRPTACWKLEWEELETNQQHFTALCKTLQDRVSLVTHSPWARAL